MAHTHGSCDFSELKHLKSKLEQLETKQFENFCRSCAKELAARLLAKVISRTPVGIYLKSTGKMGGTLRRGWTASKGIAPYEYIKYLSVYKHGCIYQIEIINPVSYASYVEFGHRTRDHKGWIPGRFMLTVSEQELNITAPQILKRKLFKLFKESFNGAY